MGDTPEALWTTFLQINARHVSGATSQFSRNRRSGYCAPAACAAGAQWHTGPMQNLILVAFVEPVTDGHVFPREDWPLHITLVRFDVKPDLASDGDDGGDAELTDRIARLIERPVQAALGARLTIGADAGFGRLGSTPVSLVEPDRTLQELHESLMKAVAELHGRVPTPQHTLANYRPHVSHRGDKRVKPGDAVVLDRIALVDMAPDGNHSVRRVLRLWEPTK